MTTTVAEQAKIISLADARLRRAAGDFVTSIVEALPERFEVWVDDIRVSYNRLEFVYDGKQYELPLMLESVPAEALVMFAGKVASGWTEQLSVLLRERTAEYNSAAGLLERTDFRERP